MSTATVSLVEIAAEWRTARRLYPFYASLIREFELDVEHSKDLENPVDRAEREVLERVQAWLNAVDEKVQVAQMRQLLQSTRFGNEDLLRALLLRHLTQKRRDDNFRDKLDYLLVQYFASVAPHNPQEGDITSASVHEALRPVLGNVQLKKAGWHKELNEIAQGVDRCTSLADLLDSGLVELGRKAKAALGAEYFDPAALVEVTRFNFRLRLGFFRLMHADLHAIRTSVQQLQALGVPVVDCRGAGLGSEEPLLTLLAICHQWKKPFREAYRAGQSFRQLGLIRKILSHAVQVQSQKRQAEGAALSLPVAPLIANGAPTDANRTQSIDVMSSPTLEQTVGAIADQLLAAKECRAVSTIVLGDSHEVLASWEVNAFVQGGNEGSEAIQRAVAARCLLSQSLKKLRSGQVNGLAQALNWAHIQAALIQEQVAKAKDRADIDAAVGLAASAKRLLALIDEAEKLKK